MKARTHWRSTVPSRARSASPPRGLTLAWSGVRVRVQAQAPDAVPVRDPADLDDRRCLRIPAEVRRSPGAQLRRRGQHRRPGADGEPARGRGSGRASRERRAGDPLQPGDAAVLRRSRHGLVRGRPDRRGQAPPRQPPVLRAPEIVTRWTYLRGKLGTVLFWGGCVVVAPVRSCAAPPCSRARSGAS